MPSHVTYAYIRQNPDIREYIRRADMSLAAIGYTEHSFAHVEKAAHNAAMILETLQYPARQVELAKIAGFLHDIGNVINRPRPERRSHGVSSPGPSGNAGG